jgi:hypothetical protein
MIPVGADYLTYEALLVGATPEVRASFLPYYWPNEVDGGGTFAHCRYVAPDRIQADYEGFSGGSWISEVITSNVQLSSSPAVITWGWNSPGFVSTFYYRGAATAAALAVAAWVEIHQGDTIQIYPYYQFKLTLEGYRAWAVDTEAQADAWTAWAEDTPEEDEYQGYAADVNVPGDALAYIEEVKPLGEFTVVRDIEQAGSVSLEAPTAFDDLVAGAHSGLLLNNRQGSLDEAFAWTPAPRYSPNKSSFFLTQQDWYGIQLRIDFGWSKTIKTEYAFHATYGSGQTYGDGGSYGDREFIVPAVSTKTFSEFITLFLGKVTKWGPVSRAVDEDGAAQPNTVEVYAVDWIMDCLQKRIALPAADGSPNPVTFGEFLCKGEAVSGWSPEAPVRSAYFKSNNYSELDIVVASGGGEVSLVTPGIIGTYGFQSKVTGASQSAYGAFRLSSPSEIFVTGTMRFDAVPAVIDDGNLLFLRIMDVSGSRDYQIYIDNTGAFYSEHGGQSKFNILGYIGVPLTFAMWLSPTDPGYARLWINMEEVLTLDTSFTGDQPIEFQFGCITGGTAENWTIVWDDLELRTKYYHNAFQVFGAPFESIGTVYVDNQAQPDSKTAGGFTQTVTRYPQYGMVTLTSTDPEFSPSGDLLIRVVEHAGGRHALEIISSLFALAGLTDYVDATALAAAYVACPSDIIHARFEGGGERQVLGLKDIASSGITIGDALKEITARCLYWIFVDAGKIKIIPYTGTPPAAPDLALTASNKWENTQVIDLENINEFITAVYGWYSRNPSLFYMAGTQEVGGQGTGLDYTWDSPVACEDFVMVKAKADLLLKFLSAWEFIDPVRMGLKGVRLELMDQVSIEDDLLNDVPVTYWVTRKEVGLDSGSREVSLQLTRFLGDSGEPVELIYEGGSPDYAGLTLDLGGVA